MVPPVCRERRNENGEKPNQLFSKANENAWYENLYWVDYGMVVATLVLGISFAETFTVPGGFNQNNGIPIFVSQTTFSIFITANVISLFASSISVIVLIYCLFILYSDRLKWILVSLTACGYLRVIMFASTRYPLLVDMFRSLYATRYLFKPKKSMLCDKKLASALLQVSSNFRRLHLMAINVRKVTIYT